MKLETYLKEYGVKRIAFAKRCGITYRTLWKLLKGGDIRLSTAKKIVQISENKVTLQDL